MKTLYKIGLGLFFLNFSILQINCQKDEGNLIAYHLEVEKADLMFRFSEDKEYRIVSNQFDTSFIVYKVKGYEKCMKIYYRYKFKKEIMGHVKIQILLNGEVQRQEDAECDQCVGKTASLKLCL